MSTETLAPQTEEIVPLNLQEVQESFETIGTSLDTVLYVQRTLATADTESFSEKDEYVREGLAAAVGGLRSWLIDYSHVNGATEKPPLRKSYVMLPGFTPDFTPGDIQRLDAVKQTRDETAVRLGLPVVSMQDEPPEIADHIMNHRPNEENQAARAEAYDEMTATRAREHQNLAELPPVLNPEQSDLLQRILQNKERELMFELSRMDAAEVNYRSLAIQLKENTLALNWVKSIVPETIQPEVEPQSGNRPEAATSATRLRQAVVAPVVGAVAAATFALKSRL